jgi:hypothetical protein
MASFSQGKLSLGQCDSLFDAGLYTAALQGYEILYKGDRIATNAMLLKMAYIYEGMGDYTMCLYMLHKYYNRNPDHEVLRRMAELAAKHEIGGYTYKEEAYILSLYKLYEKELLQVGVLLSAVLCVAIGVGKWRRGSVSFGLVFFFLLAVLFTAVVVNRSVEKEYGIVMQDGIWIYEAPASGSSAFLRLARGTRVELGSITDKWYKATIEDKRVGFVNMFHVQPVY